MAEDFSGGDIIFRRNTRLGCIKQSNQNLSSLVPSPCGLLQKHISIPLQEGALFSSSANFPSLFHQCMSPLMCSVAFFLHWEPEDCLPVNMCIKRDVSHPRSLPFFLMHWHLKAVSYNKAEKLWQSGYMRVWWSKHFIQQWVISAVTSFCHECITSANSPKQKS